MLAMLGSWLGVECLVFILLASSVQGLIAAGVFFALLKTAPPAAELDEEDEDSFRYFAIPFGPFPGPCRAEWLFFQPWILEVIYGLYGLEGP